MPTPTNRSTKIATAENTKWCTYCGEKKSLEDFHIDNDVPDGRKNQCKVCRAKIHEVESSSEMDYRLAAIEEEGLAVLADLHRGGSYSPGTEEMLESVMKPFGGSDGLSKVLYATFYQCSPGSTRRVKILEMILSLVKTNSAEQASNQSMEAMDDQDLSRIMKSAILDYQKRKGLPDDSLPVLNAKRVTSKVAVQEPIADDMENLNGTS